MRPVRPVDLFITLLLAIVIPAVLAAQPPGQRMTSEEYIALWQQVAVRKMKEHGIPASITMAQGLLESNSGNSELAREANNHFGIKCTSDWTGDKVYHDDDRRDECFRKYRDAADSYEDHSKFLQRPRYAGLFKLEPTDYKHWAHGLKDAGYATDPRYPQKLIELIERYQLDRLDKGVEIAAKPPVPPPASTKRAGRHHGSDNTVTIGSGRQVEVFEDRIKFVHAKAGDTYNSLADELEMMPGQLARYNDTDRETPIQEGQVIFIQPKRSKAKDADTHVVKEGETLWGISQQHGVKLKKLADYNGLGADAPLSPGQEVHLKKAGKK